MPQTKSTMNRNELYHIDDTRLTALNTVGNIARVIMQEVTGMTKISLHAAYNLAAMHVATLENSKETDLSDIAEFIIMLGNSSHTVTPRNIESYLRMKNEIRTNEKTATNEQLADPMKTKPNRKFRDLLANVIVGEEIPTYGTVHSNQTDMSKASLLEDISRELSLIYRTVISGEANGQKNISQGTNSSSPTTNEIPRNYIPEEFISAAKILLINFPLLTRLEIKNYQDILAGMKLEAMLPKLDQPYERQIRSTIENRVREIADEISKLSDQVNQQTDSQADQADEAIREKIRIARYAKIPASDMLHLARMGYFTANRIQAITPRISRKHIRDDDFETAICNALTNLSPEVQIDDERSDYRDARRDMVAKMYYHHAFADKDMYVTYNDVMSEDLDSTKVFDSASDRKRYFERIVEAAQEMIDKEDGKLLEIIATATGKDRKYKLESFEKILKLFWPSIIEFDPVGWMILARNSGLVPFYNKKPAEDGTKTNTSNDKIYAVGITSLKLMDSAEAAFRSEIHSHENMGVAPEGKAAWTSGNTAYVVASEFNRLTQSMVATYVHNNLIAERAAIDVMDQYNWSSPLIISPGFDPRLTPVARRISEKYPIFREIIVHSPMDVPNGIVLSMLQKMTGDYHLDHDATITQNLLVRQIHAMNSLAEMANKN